MAYRNLDYACRYASDQSRRDKALGLVNRFNASAQQMLAQAHTAYKAGDYTEALRIYRVLVCMPKLPVAADARRKLVEAEADPAVQSALREVKAAMLYDRIELLLGGWTSEPPEGEGAATSEAAPASGSDAAGTTSPATETNAAQTTVPAPATEPGGIYVIDPASTDANKAPAEGTRADCEDDLVLARQLGQKDRLRLVDLLQAVCKPYPETPTGQKAAQFTQRLMDDAEFAQYYKSRKVDDAARDHFSMGMLYLKGGNHALAREMFDKTIKEGPDTTWAEQAKAQLATMPKD
ncbi:MAG: tetratricopeptide repeat protein [Phycisphaeraceae bacterium]